jgi:chromosome partitioning protein
MRFFGYYKILKNGSFLIISYINKLLSMRTIVFATHKGGCGKSTLATCLAVAAQEAGESVAIFDLDPKNCAIRWGSKRMDRKPPVRTIAFARLSPALNAAAKRNVTLSIIDTPAFESPAALAAVKRADLTIVPVKPSALDIWAAVVTGRRMNVLREKFVFLLNQCPKRRASRRMRACFAALEAAGPLLVQQIGSSPRYLDAVAQGKGVTEIDPSGGAAREMRSLRLAIKDWLLVTPDRI